MHVGAARTRDYMQAGSGKRPLLPISVSSSDGASAPRRSGGVRVGVWLVALLLVLVLSWIGVVAHYFASHGSAAGAHDSFSSGGGDSPLVAAPNQPPASSNPYASCRVGSQRCIAWSSATAYSRFPLLMDGGGEVATSDLRMPTLLSLASDPPAVAAAASSSESAAPYDVDGTPALRQRLREYVRQHQAAHGLAAAAAEVERAALAAPGAATLSPAALRASQHALWTNWVSNQRYVLHVDGESGLGNKLLPIVSAFAYALLTRRTLLLFFSVPGMDELFELGPTSPGAEVGLLLQSRWGVFLRELIHHSRRFDPAWDLDGSAGAESASNAAHWTSRVETRLAVRDAKTRISWRNFHELVQLLPASLFGTSLPLDLQSPDSTRPKADLLCGDWAHDPAWGAAWLVYTWSDQYWLPLLAANEWSRPQLLDWVNEGNMYGPLSRFVLNWSGPLVRSRADAFAREHFSSYNIGLQLRRKERLALKKREVAAAIEGAKQLAMLYQKDAQEVRLTPTAERAAQLRRDPNGPPGTAGMQLADSQRKAHVTFFIASDDFDSRPALAALLAPWGRVAFAPQVHYPRDERRAGSGYYVPPDSGDGDTGARYREGLQWAVVENLLLSACDDLIISPSSTYGYHAAGYASLVPHRVLYEPASAPPVVRMLSAEPQAHFWKPLFREVDVMQLCRTEADLPAQAQQEECCPRWTIGG